MRNIVDQLLERVIDLQSPIVVGLDPIISDIPNFFRQPYFSGGLNQLKVITGVIRDFNLSVIDAVAPLVPAVKPQAAFYEQYGLLGWQVLVETISYAKAKGLFVILDAKRQDVGHTAAAYAQGYLGEVKTFTKYQPVYDLDFLTVSPFLGSDSLQPFIDVCHEFDKGIFVLTKTSNPGGGEIQDQEIKRGLTISEHIAVYLDAHAKLSVGRRGYSPIGAVVGATFPEQAAKLRQLMPHNLWLVPGYGAQGAGADEIVPCFNEDGLGALINSSRGILFAYKQHGFTHKTISREGYIASIKQAIEQMQLEIKQALRAAGKKLPTRADQI